jgi:nicotinate-nucleotide pyrophosphorylase (carboxylating)
MELEALVRAALAEDIGDGDRTTAWTVPETATGRARIVAKAHGVIAGREAADLVFRTLDSELALDWRRRDGDRVAPDDEVLEIGGALRSILTAERTALNFLGRLSGIATLAARYVKAVENTECRIADTRKTTPGLRTLEKRAAAAGGALNHRMGLFDMVLVKENHVRVAGGVAAALQAVEGPAAGQRLEVEIEVRTLDELDEALTERPARILLDNMTRRELQEAVRRVGTMRGGRPLLEASGGVTLENVREIAATGVDLVSIGAITHSAPALDLSLLVAE